MIINIMARRKMSALQKKYFAKRTAGRAVKPRVVYMARKRRSYGRARSYSRRARGGGGGGNMKGIIDGVLAGAAGGLATKYIGAYGAPIATLGVGWFRKNPTLTTLGGLQVGNMLVSQFTGTGGSSSGSFFQS